MTLPAPLQAEIDAPCAVPLYELLERVPITERIYIYNEDGSTHSIPVGVHCHDAAKQLRKLDIIDAQYDKADSMRCAFEANKYTALRQAGDALRDAAYNEINVNEAIANYDNLTK